MHFDVIILGSGPGGYVASIRAAQLGMKVAIIEKESVGGICLNWGCIPTKSILNSAKTLHLIKKNKDLFGIKNENIKINLPNIISKSRNSVDKIKKGILFLLKKNGIHFIHGNGVLKNKKKVCVFNKENKKISELSASHIIIATGSKPKKIEIENEISGKIISYKEALSILSLPKKITIIGSGSIGLEFAYFYHSMGSKVTIIEICEKIFPNGDDEISDYMKLSMKKIGINIYTSSFITNVHHSSSNSIMIEIKTPTKNITIDSDIIFSAIGIIPNIESIGIEEVGIQTENGFIEVDDNYCTNIDGYYAIGDVIKTPSLAHVASYEAINCVENIKGLNNHQKIDYNNIPICVYSSPEIASVGYTEKELKKKGFQFKVGKFPFSSLGKSISDGNTMGFVKVIFDDKYDEWLGCHMIGDNVTDIISEVVVARKLECTSYEILNSIHPHPSLSESIVEAIANVYGKAIHL
ncbi:dihydrolipoyl dehydrogenase [Blattabacterium cuenoti]|uniref:dihydrolipoyl dehydrogenase n=1 Tax=Blattabacterium cuenoti TaxID=1653831 RepID=UPI00163CEE37|nr:dihydrolipoyl dehydrogenase [Blattabacterium cuenoti]